MKTNNKRVKGYRSSQPPVMTVSTCVSAAKNGRIFIVGAAGFIGRFVAEASLDAGQPTYVLVRPGPLDPSKADIIKGLKDRGAIIIHVCL